jgi:hypothetical protein
MTHQRDVYFDTIGSYTEPVVMETTSPPDRSRASGDEVYHLRFEPVGDNLDYHCLATFTNANENRQ